MSAKTSQGNLALLTVHAGETLFVDALELFSPSAQVILSRRDLSIRGSYTFDVEGHIRA